MPSHKGDHSVLSFDIMSVICLSFLSYICNMLYNIQTCKYVHYELDQTPDVPQMMAGAIAPPRQIKPQRAEYCSEIELGESQWINCDIRNFRMDILGQFGVIMADPPWDIHMELPYGTMADDEMRTLNVPTLQTDGLIFLWVTGRAMELGREW
jgi:mRNA m6A methyltransferase catalytic subunit